MTAGVLLELYLIGCCSCCFIVGVLVSKLESDWYYVGYGRLVVEVINDDIGDAVGKLVK